MSADAPAAVQPEDLRVCTMRETLHGHGAKGMWMYEYVCVEHPRLRKRTVCPQRNAPVQVTAYVDGVEVELAVDAIAAALNRPHDLAGCAERLSKQLFRAKAVRLEGDRLIVEGESEERCAMLGSSYPSFEGVPIVWVPA